MRCYNHQKNESVAVCRACGRALCRECARETEGGIACSEECTETAISRKALHRELETHLQNARRAGLLSAFFSIGMGILFILFSNMGFGIVYDFVLVLGIGFTLYGAVALLVNMIIFFRHRQKERLN